MADLNRWVHLAP
jgi:hypothetical protein